MHFELGFSIFDSAGNPCTWRTAEFISGGGVLFLLGRVVGAVFSVLRAAPTSY
jgi:hypothetical protein